MTQTEALKLALEALERVNVVDDDCDILAPSLADAVVEAITEVKAALEAKDEIVAWIEHHKGGDNLVWDDPSGERTPLYTTPQQRTFVGLTDEEIEQGCRESWVTEQAFQSAVWWAEAKLRSKNYDS
jgi:hypothetical protein